MEFHPDCTTLVLPGTKVVDGVCFGLPACRSCRSVCLSLCRPVCLSVCQSVSLSVCQSVSLSVRLYSRARARVRAQARGVESKEESRSSLIQRGANSSLEF